MVCAIKRDKRNYEYQGEQVNFKELVAKLKKEKKESRCRRWNTRYFEVVVKYGKLVLVKLYISRFPYQKEWRIFLSTDTNLNFIEMMKIYSIRWTIEVFFKMLTGFILFEKLYKLSIHIIYIIYLTD